SYLVDCAIDPLGAGRRSRGLAVGAEQEAAGLGAAADADRGDLHVLSDLPLPRLAPQLDAGLVQEAVAVQPAGGQLAAVGVDRQLAGRRVVLGVIKERADLAVLAEAERLDPLRGDVAEAVVERGEVHAARGEAG